MYVAAVYATHVTTASAVAQQADILIVMRRGKIVVCMATGTIGLEGREWPCDDLVVGPMAVDAKYRCPVVAWIIRRIVPEIDQRRPDSCIVAAVAIKGRHKVGRRLAGRDRAVVTAQTKAIDNRVVESRGRPPGCEMATVTFHRGRQVGSVLARRDGPVMAR